MRELCQIVVIHVQTVQFKLFGGLPGPGIGITRRDLAKLEGVLKTRMRGDRAQELPNSWISAAVEHLESVTGLQQCLEGLEIICQSDRNKHVFYTILRGR